MPPSGRELCWPAACGPRAHPRLPTAHGGAWSKTSRARGTSRADGAHQAENPKHGQPPLPSHAAAAAPPVSVCGRAPATCLGREKSSAKSTPRRWTRRAAEPRRRRARPVRGCPPPEAVGPGLCLGETTPEKRGRRGGPPRRVGAAVPVVGASHGHTALTDDFRRRLGCVLVDFLVGRIR